MRIGLPSIVSISGCVNGNGGTLAAGMTRKSYRSKKGDTALINAGAHGLGGKDVERRKIAPAFGVAANLVGQLNLRVVELGVEIVEQHGAAQRLECLLHLAKIRTVPRHSDDGPDLPYCSVEDVNDLRRNCRNAEIVRGGHAGDGDRRGRRKLAIVDADRITGGRRRR